MKLISALFLSVLASCAAAKADLVAFEKGAVTCAKAAEPAVKALGLELTTVAVADLLGGKSPTDTFDDVKARAEAGVKTDGLPVAACAFDGTLAKLESLLHPATLPQVTGSALVAFDKPDPLDAGRAALAAFEAAHGVTSVRQ
jgi:hypothetical protein